MTARRPPTNPQVAELFSAKGSTALSRNIRLDAPMENEFLPPLADASEFPAAKVPALPPLSWKSFFARGKRIDSYVQDCNASYTFNGRAALAELARLLGVGPGDAVLLPAYHCPSLVEPFLAAGARADFYKMSPDLSPDGDDFLRRLKSTPHKAVVFVKFFGFTQEVELLARAARAAGVAVIHDCAHAYFALRDVPREDSAIASLVKFFPLPDGGLIRPSDAYVQCAVGQNPQRVGYADELKALFKVLEYAGQWSRLFPLGLFAFLVGRVSRAMRRKIPTVESARPRNDRAFRYFNAGAKHLEPSHLSLQLCKMIVSSRAMQIRRKNYQRLVKTVARCKGGYALYPTLPAQHVPYVFPLVLGAPRIQFPAIRDRCIPLYRWEEISPSGCPTAMHYRSSLVQLPCHESLSRKHLALITNALCEVLAAS